MFKLELHDRIQYEKIRNLMKNFLHFMKALCIVFVLP